jgi:hypothetical protein
VYTVTVRSGSKVRRSRFESPAEALDHVRDRARELEKTGRRAPVGGGLMRRIEPVRQVIGRIELKGPGGLRVGVDVRGDGSSEAFSGRIRRRLVEQRTGESACDALARAVRERSK